MGDISSIPEPDVPLVSHNVLLSLYLLCSALSRGAAIQNKMLTCCLVSPFCCGQGVSPADHRLSSGHPGRAGPHQRPQPTGGLQRAHPASTRYNINRRGVSEETQAKNDMLFGFAAGTVRVHACLFLLWSTCRTAGGVSCFHDS